MTLQLITAPTVDPVTTQEAWNHLRTGDSPADATRIARLITSATAHFDGRDGWLGRQIVQATWEIAMDDFPDNSIRVPLPPLQSITSIKYIDTDGVEQTLSASDMDHGWQLSEDLHWRPLINLKRGKTWPSVRDDEPDAVKVRYVCGYQGDGASPEDFRANVPEPIKDAILLMVQQLYDQEDSPVIQRTINALAMPYRAG